MTLSSLIDTVLYETMHQSLPSGLDIGLNEKMHQYECAELLKISSSSASVCDTNVRSSHEVRRLKKTKSLYVPSSKDIDKRSSLTPFSKDEIDLQMFPRRAFKTSTDGNTKNVQNKSKQALHRRRNSDPIPTRVHLQLSKSFNSLKEDRRSFSSSIGSTASVNGIGNRKSVNRNKSQRYLRRCDSDRSLPMKSNDTKDQTSLNVKHQRRCTLRQTPVLPESKIFLQLQIAPPVSTTEETKSMSSNDDAVSYPRSSLVEVEHLKQQQHPRIVVERYPRPPPLLPLEDPLPRPKRGTRDEDKDDVSDDHLFDLPALGSTKDNHNDEKKKLAHFPFLRRKFNMSNIHGIKKKKRCIIKLRCLEAPQ